MTAARIALISALGVGCLVASGVGGYLAVRTGTSSAATPAVAAMPAGTPHEAVAPAIEAAEPTPTPTAAVEPDPSTPTAAARPVRTTASPAVAPVVANRAPSPEAPAVAADPIPDPSAVVANGARLEAFSASRFPAATLEPVARELTIPSDSVVGIRLESDVSSETSRVEDRVVARVTRDVLVDDETAIPAGATLEGSVMLVEQGGKFRDRSRVGIRFTSVVVDDARIPIETEAIYREGEPPTGEATSKIGASAVIGTILGAVIGGKKGAAIGGTAGAAGGTAVVMAGDRNPALIPAGTPLTVRLASPLTVSVLTAP